MAPITPQSPDIAFTEWMHKPLPMNLNLSPDQTKAMIEGGIHELMRIAYEAGYKTGYQAGRADQVLSTLRDKLLSRGNSEN